MFLLLSLNSPLNVPSVEEYIKIGEAREGFVIKILHPARWHILNLKDR